MRSKTLFVLGLAFCLTSWASPPLALVAGLLFGSIAAHPYPGESRQISKYLLQAAVVGLGFGMNLNQVIRVGRSGFLYTAVGIAFALLVGTALANVVAVDRRAAFLISTGTAICGGSAIAAVGPVVKATEDEMSVSLGTIFLLNSVALLTFPVIGAALKLTQSQFGLWAALAIHDTSSVVGACSKYGPLALTIGTTVKLARALWIVPITIAAAVAKGGKTRIQWPWFILFFCLAALLNTLLPTYSGTFGALNHLGRIGLTVTLFLIGTGLNKKTLAKVGVRPLLQGLILWVIVGSTTLALILGNWIHL
jgi:uncharacterized integral membrane protein (TIGR00698 family)